MAGSPIDIKRLERVLEPLVEAGLRLSSVWRATNHTSLSQAISASLLQRQDLTPEMTDALRELRLRSLLTSKLGEVPAQTSCLEERQLAARMAATSTITGVAVALTTIPTMTSIRAL